MDLVWIAIAILLVLLSVALIAGCDQPEVRE
jgi:hypothetical protein